MEQLKKMIIDSQESDKKIEVRIVSVARSCKSRRMRFYYDGVEISEEVSQALKLSYDDYKGAYIVGYGMNMIFSIIYQLVKKLFTKEDFDKPLNEIAESAYKQI